MSKLFTFSKGISKSKELSKLLGSEICAINPGSFQNLRLGSVHAVIGWGKKANTDRARKYAGKNNMPYWSLEDGFISYLGHPALGDHRFSLIVDKTGVYYDAARPSDIEDLLNNFDWFTPELQARSASLLDTIRKYQISKYNHEPVGWVEERNPTAFDLSSGIASESVGFYPKGHKHSALPNLREPQNQVLVVDQTYGDCSVKYGMADDSSFRAMLDAALSENPDSEVWVKVHPDVVLGKKKGYFELEACGQKIKGFDNDRIRVLAEKVNAQSLFPYFNKVYVVTSQLGFEALWHGKEVACFGVPFYSGWSLTDDRVPCRRRKQKHTIESLFAAACLKYTRYIDPETGERCELEDVIELIALQGQFQQQEVNRLYLVGFSLWKRAFLTQFLGGLAESFKFVKSAQQASALAKAGDGVLIWGAKDYDYAPPAGVKLFRCEDAFIRGKGLGAELKRPQSLIVDRRGIYFDGSQPSDLEQAINNIRLSAEQMDRGAQLRERLVNQRISKYNLTGKPDNLFSGAKPAQKKLLVTGQVDSDASIKYGSPEVRSNLALLQRVRDYAPDAYIVYKPHPDVVMAGRAGHIPEDEVLKWADQLATDSDIFDCIAQCDALHVMTSLAGFEALLQHKTVHTWGTPFYSGWGLTVDHHPCERRLATRTIDELVYLAHCHYPRYINWATKRFTTPERMIQNLASEKQQLQKKSNLVCNWFGRNRRKVQYLLEALWG